MRRATHTLIPFIIAAYLINGVQSQCKMFHYAVACVYISLARAPKGCRFYKRLLRMVLFQLLLHHLNSTHENLSDTQICHPD